MFGLLCIFFVKLFFIFPQFVEHTLHHFTHYTLYITSHVIHHFMFVALALAVLGMSWILPDKITYIHVQLRVRYKSIQWQVDSHKQQHQHSYRYSSLIVISLILLSFTFGSVTLLAATLLWHPDVMVDLVEEVHSTIVDHLQKIYFMVKSRGYKPYTRFAQRYHGMM